jgi:SHS2 domain-containing protein
LPTIGTFEIDADALYLLAGPTVPEAAREEAVAAAEAGEHVTRATPSP